MSPSPTTLAFSKETSCLKAANASCEKATDAIRKLVATCEEKGAAYRQKQGDNSAERKSWEGAVDAVVQAQSEQKRLVLESNVAAKALYVTLGKEKGEKNAQLLVALKGAGVKPYQLINAAGFTKEECIAAGAKKCTFLDCVSNILSEIVEIDLMLLTTCASLPNSIPIVIATQPPLIPARIQCVL